MRVKLDHYPDQANCFLLSMDKIAAQTFITILEEWIIDDDEKTKFQKEFIDRMSAELSRQIFKIV